MNILLKKYIENYLTEATSKIAFPAKNISGKLQHKIGASYQNNMTNLNNEETLLKVLENVGDNCFISFVDKYDEKIPRLEINPNVEYETPHGNYAYPLTVKILKEIIEQGSIGEAEFALDRPYFHIFKKSNNVNAINIEKDAKNNYTGDFRKDLKTIVHTAVMFKASKYLEMNPNNKPSTHLKTYVQQSKKKAHGNIRNLIDNMNFDKIQKFGYKEINIFKDNLNKLIKELCYFFLLNNNKFPAYETRLIVDFISQQIFNMSKFKIDFVYFNSSINNFFDEKTKKSASEFHILYFACLLLSSVVWSQGKKERKGSVFTMLLNSIDINFINDKGSSTLHDYESIQAVYLNSSKKENVVLVGTFNNIFNTKNSITMEKIVNVIEKNKNLLGLFNSALFNNN